MRIRHLIRITGIVQGVGFRPFVYRLARDLGLDGFVLNDGEGVFLEAEGSAKALRALARDLKAQAPAAARIDSIRVTPAPPVGHSGFEIRRSRESAEKMARISPDLATCPACLADLLEEGGRRYLYPFTNCTLCGPRFTIIRDVPYDRARTTMARFRMCPQCRAEYDDPADRRFHAQPNACPVCGPSLSLFTASGARIPSPDVLREVRILLDQGMIVAVKGLGGYHLAADATNELAVRRLRDRKVREEKPFALMAADLDAVRVHARVSAAEARVLSSVEAPIVLLRRRATCPLPESIAPNQAHLGFFLPYTPLHHLLFTVPDNVSSEGAGKAGEAGGASSRVLVMTSGNRSDEPIAYHDEDARQRLADIADYFLLHDRPIHLRCDDSVVRVAGGKLMMLRRSRGYVPRVTRLPWPVPAHVLAVGALLKNTYALAKGFDCYVGPHVGDLENLETSRAFEEGIRHLERLFDIHPTVVAYDPHPDYLSTRFALGLEMEEAIACQHHEAHVASVIGEHALEEPVIGVAFDGTGYGSDGTIWGGEFFVVRDRAFTRAAHLRPVPLPGGDQAAREPWRAAVAYLRAGAGSEDESERALDSGSRTDPGSVQSPGSSEIRPAPDAVADPVRSRFFSEIPRQSLDLVGRMLDHRVNCPLSSGAGRAFDAAASLILGRHRAAYEGQGPMELEQLAHRAARPSAFAPLAYALDRSDAPWRIDLAPAFQELVGLLVEGKERREALALRFHLTVSEAVCETAAALAEREGIRTVCVSGGVFQNQLLLKGLEMGLKGRGLRMLRNIELPPNDGGISFGQMVLASWRAFQQAPARSGGGTAERL